jgi:hypothetical protein
MVREGDKAWIVPNAGGEPHPAIVIRISKDGRHALVISGTGTGPRDFPHEAVDPNLRVNKALRFSKKTYFYQNAVHVRAVGEVIVRDTPPIRCPRALWERLQVLALAGAREKLSRKDFSDWWPNADPLSVAGSGIDEGQTGGKPTVK